MISVVQLFNFSQLLQLVGCNWFLLRYHSMSFYCAGIWIKCFVLRFMENVEYGTLWSENLINYLLHHDCRGINCLFSTLISMNAQARAHCSPYKGITKSDTCH